VPAIDRPGSMASSVVFAPVVFASVSGAVLAPMRSPRTSLVVFGTSVADLAPLLAGPGGRAVRHAAWRRHGHQPGGRLLPG